MKQQRCTFPGKNISIVECQIGSPEKILLKTIILIKQVIFGKMYVYTNRYVCVIIDEQKDMNLRTLYMQIQFIFVCVVFQVSLCSSDCPRTHSVDQTGLEFRDPPAFAS